MTALSAGKTAINWLQLEIANILGSGEEKGEYNIRFSMHFWLCKESVTAL